MTVQLDPGEVAQVTLSTTMSQTGEFVVSVNGQDPQVVTVSNNSTALNAVTPVGLSVIG